MESLFSDPQASLTVFVPIDGLPHLDDEPTFERARTIVNSVTVPSALTYSVLAQGCRRYKTRDNVNTVTTDVTIAANETHQLPTVTLNGVSRFLMTDVKTSNGIMHLIDKFPYF